MMKYYTTVVTKKTYPQSPQQESENYAGCMPSLYRLFDFRRNQKLIANRNYNINHPVVESNEKVKFNGDLFENKGVRVQSVKTLMEEEMEKLIPIDGTHNQISNSNLEKTERNSNSILMIPPSPESFNFTNTNENNSDMESNLSSKEIYFKLHEASNYHDNNNYNDDNHSEGYSRIVILKPSLSRITSPIHSNRFSDRNLHHFSITELKQRLKQKITERRTELIVLPTGEEKSNSFSYEEAKKHLMERVESLEMKSRVETGNERTVLSRLILFPDFDLLSSPVCTPKKKDFDKDGFKFECLEKDQEDYECDVLGPVANTKGGEEILDLLEEINEEENDEYLESDESLDLIEEGYENEAESSYLSEEEMSPNYSEILEEKKTIFGDLTKSPSRSTKYEEIPIQRTIIKFREPEIFPLFDPSPNYSTILNNNETRSEFISTVLKASELFNSNTSNFWIEKTEPSFLDPFLYDEIGVSYDYTEESKILFDLIEESLYEIKNKYFIFGPKMKFVPFGETLIREVCKWVEGYLTHGFPCYVDQVVKRDLDLGSNWMDFRPDLEIIVLDLGEELLDDLLEDLVFDLWFLKN